MTVLSEPSPMTSSPMTSLDDAPNLPRWFSIVFGVASGIEIGALAFRLPDGRVFEARGAQPGPTGLLIVHNPKMFGRLVRDGEMGFAESYMDGWWSTPDLQAVMDVVLLNNEPVARKLSRAWFGRVVDRIRHWLNRNTRAQAKRNIAAHYDLGNAFYGLWLDRSMTYSSALFTQPGQSLEDAQRQKYRSICDRMNLRQGDHVLEIGCGWGGFAEYAARERGAMVTGLTISAAQLAFAQQRMQREGLNERVDLKLRDYRDERGRYDGVVSIEMFEAVGERYWPSYFDVVRERLKPGGIGSLQTITIADHLFESYRSGVDFVQKYIFPGGMLPSPSRLQGEVRRAGLEWIDSIEFGESYSETLRRWRARFDTIWSEIEGLAPRSGAQPFDARFRRMWEFYLCVCASCFRAGTTDVTQIAIRRA